MNYKSIDAIVKGMLPALREYIDAHLSKSIGTLTTLIDERIKAIPAPAQGPKGETGEKGEAGKDGAPGRDGEAGKPGDRGAEGARGIDGRDGRDGKDGIASRDEITALVEAEVEKRLEVEVVKRIEAAIAALPIVTYKGVYAPDKTYVPGNLTTFGGDVWHANEVTTDKPGTSKAWTLAVKKGRDGREPERKALYNGARP